MAEPNEEACTVCGQDLAEADAESWSLVRSAPEARNCALVRVFCSEACAAKWFLARLAPQQLVNVLDTYLSRGSEPVRQPFWYGRG
ncbi:hypothetical protein AB0L70_35640 [Kribbella sp. NPDC051952]|uniref:hypothetical protein n=1 Tax=Kribbella sp. NPDC051952 TaxID=3154851 RepID=UPI0034410A25